MVSLSSSVAATVIAAVAWFAFIVLYLAFYAGNMDFWQKAAIFLASGAIVIGIIAVFWIRYAFKAAA
jgi:membrane protein DedA with SNARE-associated domain